MITKTLEIKVERNRRTPIEQFDRQTILVRQKEIKAARLALKALRDNKMDDNVNPHRHLNYAKTALNDLIKENRASIARIVAKSTSNGKFTIIAKSLKGDWRKGLCTNDLKDSLKCVINNYRESIRIERKNRQIRYQSRYYKDMDTGCLVFGRHSLGYVHKNPGDFLRLAEIKKSKVVFFDKKPQTDARHVGVELEFCSKSTMQDIAKALVDAKVGQFVTLKDDGSLRVNEPGDHTHELCVVAPETEIDDVIKRALAVLGPIGYVNKTCGMHVHIDCRSLVGRDYRHVFNNLVAAQPVLYGMVPESRRTNTYCKRTRGRDADIERHRYRGINSQSLRRHKTIEVRIHSGTLDYTKISNWIKILVAIADAPIISGFLRTPMAVKRACDLSADLVAYIKDRTNKFKRTAPDSRPAEDNEHVRAAA